MSQKVKCNWCFEKTDPYVPPDLPPMYRGNHICKRCWELYKLHREEKERKRRMFEQVS